MDDMDENAMVYTKACCVITFLSFLIKFNMLDSAYEIVLYKNVIHFCIIAAARAFIKISAKNKIQLEVTAVKSRGNLASRHCNCINKTSALH